jgi:hypothetical protein
VNNYMRVACINERPGYKQIQKGDQYLLDRSSIWIDSDGDAYGMFYNLQHFSGLCRGSKWQAKEIPSLWMLRILSVSLDTEQ